MLKDLISAVIDSQHGWAVSEQFEATFDGESFEVQNYNALRYIRDTVETLLQSDLLSDTAQDILQTYRDELEDYMVGAE